MTPNRSLGHPHPAESHPGRANQPRIRIAYFVNMMHVGGTELNAVRVAERLDRSRFELVVATMAKDGPLFERYRKAGIRVAQFPITSLYNRSALNAGMRLVRFLRRERIEVLHAHDIYSNIFAVPCGRLARVPAVIASRRWTHPADHPRLDVANRLVYKLAHRVVGNSGMVARMLRDVDGVPASRVLEIPNFVDDAAFQPPTPATAAAFRLELGIPSDALVIGNIARLVEVKDHSTLLRAMALLMPRWPSLRVVLVGDGPLRGRLEQMARELGIADRTHFAGFRTNEPNLHHLFDISTLTSLSEGFPNSIVEAMAAARPVVATNVGGNVDAVRDGTGLLVPPADATRMADAFDRLLADERLRARMGANAREVARAEYHAESIIGRLEAVYCGLLGRTVAARTPGISWTVPSWSET